MRIKVRHIGLWSWIFGIYPFPTQLFTNKLEAWEKEMIAKYIDQSPIVEYTGRNIFSQTHSLIEPNKKLMLTLRSNGNWMYPESLSYYVMQGVMLPEEFLAQIRNSNYIPSESSVDYRKINDDFGFFWTWWSLYRCQHVQHTLLHLLKIILFYPIRILLWPISAVVQIR